MKLLPLLIHLPLIFFLALQWQKRRQANSKIYWIFFSLKQLAGWALGFLYIYYYQANDTWSFFEAAQKVSHLARTDFTQFVYLLWNDDLEVLSQLGLLNVQDRSLFFVRIISVVNLFCLDNYWVVASYFSFFSFVASWVLYERVKLFFEKSATAAALAFLFWPSVIFWSSGIIKESLALSGIFIMAALLLGIVQNRKVKVSELFLLAASLFLAWNLKYYWAAIFLVSAFAVLIYYLTEIYFPQVSKVRIPVLFLVLLALLWGVSFLHPNFYLERFLEVVVTNHNQFIALSRPDAIIHFHNLNPTWQSVLSNAPLAFFSCLFRPWLGEAHGFTSWLAAAENTLMIVLFLASLTQLGKIVSAPHRVLLWIVLVYCTLLGVFLALSTPNFGTLSRYRVGFLPFFIFIISYCNPLLVWMGNTFQKKWSKSFE